MNNRELFIDFWYGVLLPTIIFSLVLTIAVIWALNTTE